MVHEGEVLGVVKYVEHDVFNFRVIAHDIDF